MHLRNFSTTYFRAYYDARGRMVLCQKVVYGEVELQHCYEYHDNGSLKQAEITEADESRGIFGVSVKTIHQLFP